MVKAYLKTWDFMRLVRLVLGIFIVVNGVQTGEWQVIALGALFTLMPLLNVGCCSTDSYCNNSPVVASKNNQPEDVKYEEVK